MNYRNSAGLCGGCGKDHCICRRFRKRRRKYIPSQLARMLGRRDWRYENESEKFKYEASRFRDLVQRITQTKTLEERMIDEVLEKLDRGGY